MRKGEWVRPGFVLAVLVIIGGPVLAAPNQPPQACFTVAPAPGTVATSFTMDAQCSTDDKTAPSKLRVRWDWDGGGYDTALTTTKVATHAYATEGVMTIQLQVWDQQGLTGTTTRVVRVNPIITDTFVGEVAAEADVDINPLNPANLVLSAPAYISGNPLTFPAFASFDGGASWAQSTGAGPVYNQDPNVEFDGAGRVFLSVLDNITSDGTPQGVIVSTSLDGGRTFPEIRYAMDTSILFRRPDG